MKFFQLFFLFAFFFFSLKGNASSNLLMDGDYENLMTCKSDELFKAKKFTSFENSEVYQEKTIENFDRKIVILYFWSTIYQSLDEELKDLNSLAIYLKEQKISDIVILPIYTTSDNKFTIFDSKHLEYQNELKEIYQLIRKKYDEYDLKNLSINIDTDNYFASLKGDGDNFDDCDFDNLNNLHGHRGILPAIFIIDKNGKQIAKYLQSLTTTANDPKWNSREMHNYLRSLRGE